MHYAMTETGLPQHRSRRPAARPRSWALSYSPAALAAFVAMFGLAFLPLLGSIGALLFLAGGMALMLGRPGEALAALRREWLVVTMALWCLSSFMWSDYPSLTFRHGIQLVLTVAIMTAMCQRVMPATFLKILLLVQFLAATVSLASGRARGDGEGFLGIYGSKNALSMASAVLIIASLSMLIDRRQPRVWRLLALGGLGVGGTLLLMGNSVGALVGVLGVVAAFGAIVVLQRLSPAARLAAIALGAVLLAAGGVMLSLVFDELSRAFLDLTGKDLTLTGRTDLWAAAFREIAERPLLGAGFQAVWVHGNPLAEQLWAMFGIESRQGFNFHNTLISNAVEIGLIGAAMQAAIFFAALVSTLAWALRSPSAASVFYALFMVRQFLSMGVEVVFFFQFDLSTAITLAAVCHAHGFRRAVRSVKGHPHTRTRSGPLAVP